MNVVGMYRKDPNQGQDFSSVLAPRLKVGSVNGDVDLRPFCTSTNQYSLSACAGNSTADAVEILDRIDGKPSIELSRLFVYAKARELHQELNKDRGTYISTCFEVLSRFGICSEAAWPYLTEKVHVTPSIKALREATGHKIHSYYRIGTGGHERVDAVITALRAKHPVVFGTLIPTWFGEWRGTSVINHPKDDGPTAGGHAMILVGWDSGKSAFIVKNSWGRAWGDDGFWYMSPEYLAWENTWDLWVPTRGYSFRKPADETTVTVIKDE
jgi:C1A family cysteine protease